MGETQDKNIYCPFHGESRTAGSKPSARFYTNTNPVKLWCFQEHRSYFAYHYIKQIMHKNPLDYLISHITEKKINYYIQDYNENIAEENEKTYSIKSLNDINELYKTLNATKDYSKWYLT